MCTESGPWAVIFRYAHLPLLRAPGVRNNELMARLLLLTVLSVAAFAQEHPQQPYLISIGAESSTVPTGTIWLYSLSGYGVHRVKLAQIENGRALMPSDFEEAKRELNPSLA